MPLDCPNCGVTFPATDGVGSYQVEDEADGLPFKTLYELFRCPECERPVVAGCDYWGQGWDDPVRVLPEPRQLSTKVPKSIRSSLEEAQRCFNARCYVATVMMCRRTLESLAKHQGATERGLAGLIRTLQSKGVIEARLLEWAEALRTDGNVAAHDPDAEFTKADAADLLAFAEAILDYVYVLTAQFEEYKARREKKKDVAEES